MHVQHVSETWCTFLLNSADHQERDICINHHPLLRKIRQRNQIEMQLSAASSLSISSPIPRAFSPSQSTLSSCNSVFFNHGRKDLFTRNNSSARAMVMTRNRAQKGLSVRCLFGLGVPELAVIGGVALLLFGPKQIPEVGRTIGKTVKGFQQVSVCVFFLFWVAIILLGFMDFLQLGFFFFFPGLNLCCLCCLYEVSL